MTSFSCGLMFSVKIHTYMNTKIIFVCVLKELKQSHCFLTEKRRGLTKSEKELFLDYLKNIPASKCWYPVFAVMIGTELRVGELTGFR